MDRWILRIFVLTHMDCFVFLTRHMVERLGVAGRPWIVMEGAVNPEDANAESRPPVADSALKVVLYTGTLHKAYGILDLLEAFSLVPDPTCRMWICGAGDAEPEVRSMVARDPRVRYLGQLTRSEVLTLQRNATVLINPRGDTAEFTKYSFPSKILEYMLSGTPAIVRRLPGMPDEYLNYLFVVEGSAPADMAKKISEVCNRSSVERVQFGERARRFVIEQKSGVVQARRILDLIRRAWNRQGPVVRAQGALGAPEARRWSSCAISRRVASATVRSLETLQGYASTRDVRSTRLNADDRSERACANPASSGGLFIASLAMASRSNARYS